MGHTNTSSLKQQSRFVFPRALVLFPLENLEKNYKFKVTSEFRHFLNLRAGSNALLYVRTLQSKAAQQQINVFNNKWNFIELSFYIYVAVWTIMHS